jgi:hypothetical protein
MARKLIIAPSVSWRANASHPGDARAAVGMKMDGRIKSGHGGFV